MFVKKDFELRTLSLGYPLSMMLMLTGCAPLQQAPLVYTSGQTIGLKVGAAPTQAEAFEIVIGAKILDAAYAPVAVARPPTGDLSGNSRVDWGIKEIYGVFGEELTPDSHKRLKPEELRHVQEYLQAAAELKQAEAALQTQSNALAGRQAELDTKQGLNAAAVKAVEAEKDACLKDPGKCDAAKLQQLDGELKRLNEVANDLKGQRNQLTDEGVKKAKGDVDVRMKRLEGTQSSAIEALQKLSNVRKKDALSVYGSFNSDTNGNRSTAGPGGALKLGKVFSTGVAAQNLSEAEKSNGLAMALGTCMNSLAEIAVKLQLQGAAQESFMKTGMEKCTALGKPEATKS